MKIIEAINRIDSLKPNAFSVSEKIRWLSEVDSMVKEEILDTHQGEYTTQVPYNDETSTETELLIPDTHCEVYDYYLGAKCDYYNSDTASYSNSMVMFNAAFNAYQNQFNRTHLPKQVERKYF